MGILTRKEKTMCDVFKTYERNLQDCPPEKLPDAIKSVEKSIEKYRIMNKERTDRLKKVREYWDLVSVPFIKQNEVKWIESRRLNICGYRGLIGYRVIEFESSDRFIEYAISFCSPKDEFIKKISKNSIISEFFSSSNSRKVVTIPLGKHTPSDRDLEIFCPEIIMTHIAFTVLTGQTFKNAENVCFSPIPQVVKNLLSNIALI